MSTPTPLDFTAAHARICALCDRFEERVAEVKAPEYKEAVARVEFISPFFKALGWDVDNEQHRSIYEKDCVLEKAELIEGSARSADYAFRRPGTHLIAFYVEAKKPAVDILNHTDCHQAVRYGWNAGTPLVVLTDFEQFLILDSRAEADRHNATRHVLKANGAYRFTDYRDPDKFAELWGLFGREAVAAGAMDKAAAALPRLSSRIHVDDLSATGNAPVDETFLAQMELWRERLAKSLKKTNPDLGGERLTSLTQRILDRLVFLRFLEDRAIERDITFRQLSDAPNAWAAFLKISHRLDARYNGIIYKKDADCIEDTALDVDGNLFAEIAGALDPRNSKYLFATIPVTILGSIYERFLGNVIVATEKTARLDPKPEVRKAGGVYYTPDYIVRYIVAETVGRCIAGKEPAEIEAMRFADIACGSGSFLVEVFAALIRYHLRWYLDDKPEAWVKQGVLRRRELDGDLVLTLREKRRILGHCVFGVDLDPQATEVTQLSLYLRLLEDESFPSTQLLFDEEHRALLPDLRENIVCGNSLIETDIAGLFGLAPEDEVKIHPLDLRWCFPSVFRFKEVDSARVQETPTADEFISFGTGPMHGSYARGRVKKPKTEPKPPEKLNPEQSPWQGGFDAIVGNPPYVRQEQLKLIKTYLQQRYNCFAGTADLYAFFMERGISLLRRGGRYGIIVSSSFLRANYAEALRETLKERAAVERVVDFGGLPVFAAAKDTYVCIPLLSTSPQPPRIEIVRVNTLDPDRVESRMRETDYTIPHRRFSRAAWSLARDEEIALFEKLCSRGQSLGRAVNGAIHYGIKTALNDAFIIATAQRNAVVAESPKSASLMHPCRGGEDVREYFIRPQDAWIIVIPCGFTRAQMKIAGVLGQARAWDWFCEHHSLIAAHLAPFEKALKARQDQGEFWWELRPCDYYGVFARPKIVFPDICKHPRFCFDDTGLYLTNTAYALGTDDKYLLGLLNSPVFWFCIRHISIPFGVRAGEFRYRLIYQYMEQVPVRIANLDDREDASRHDRLVKLVDQILSAKKREADSAGATKDNLNRQIATLDRQINALVYELYGLTDEEIALVERPSSQERRSVGA